MTIPDDDIERADPGDGGGDGWAAEVQRNEDSEWGEPKEGDYL
jgi:hypothetical protein